jgi:hypothetical protein
MIVVCNHDRIIEQSVRILAAQFLQQAPEKLRPLVSAYTHTDVGQLVGHRIGVGAQAQVFRISNCSFIPFGKPALVCTPILRHRET